jgi:uncharacterized membrane protein HdeD (DUF308 family)
MDSEQGYGLSKSLVLAGGLIAIVLGGVQIVMSGALINREVLTGTFSLVVGIIAVIVTTDIRNEPIDILLVVLGFVIGNFGGILVGVGGIVALLSRYMLPKEQKEIEAQKV